jgi:hypothetical protein
VTKDTIPEKRYTLIVALLNRHAVRARHDLADTFVRRMAASHNRANEELEVVQRSQRTQADVLVVLPEGVVEILVDQSDKTTIANRSANGSRPRAPQTVSRELRRSARS